MKIRLKGYALIVSIYVILLFAVLAITIAAFIATEAVSNAFALNAVKALHLAEGGAEYALAKRLVGDLNWQDNNGQNESNVPLGEGVFDYTLYSTSASKCTIEAYGYINRGNLISGISRRVRIEVKQDIEEALLNAMYASDRINLNNTTGSVNGGDLISGQDVISQLGGSYGITSYETISFPSINWNYYKSLAQTGGTYYGGDLTLGNITKNGIIYVEGNVWVNDNVTINGSLIVQGKINMNQAENLYISSEAYYPALASNQLVTGEILATHLEDSYINGLIYSSGNVTFNVIEDVTVVGGIVCEGRVSMVNGTNFSLTYDPRIQNTAGLGTTGNIIIEKWVNF